VTDTLFRLDNQIAVVTGACGKLGPVWVEALVDAGAGVAALDLAGAPMSARQFWVATAALTGAGLLAGFTLLTYFATVHRGPNWHFYWWPSQWPVH